MLEPKKRIIAKIQAKPKQGKLNLYKKIQKQENT